MNSRERAERLFAHKETDRVPIDFGATVVTCMDLHAHRKLKQSMGIVDKHDPIIDYSMGTVAPCEQLMQRFGADFRRISMNVFPQRLLMVFMRMALASN